MNVHSPRATSAQTQHVNNTATERAAAPATIDTTRASLPPASSFRNAATATWIRGQNALATNKRGALDPAMAARMAAQASAAADRLKQTESNAPEVSDALRETIADLNFNLSLFKTDVDPNHENITRGELSDPREILVYNAMVNYAAKFGEDLQGHDGAKKTIVAAGAAKVLKIYPTPGIYDKELAAYALLEASGANMANFIGQDDWDFAAGTALADALQPDTEDNRHEVARNGSGAILADLMAHGLTLRDVGHGDNIGVNMDGRVVVFDVKSLEKIPS